MPLSVTIGVPSEASSITKKVMMLSMTNTASETMSIVIQEKFISYSSD